MKTYVKVGMTVMLIAAFFLLSGFRAQTIIHDDGSETQDVLKVSETASGQKKLRDDADEFQKRNYTIMDYSNGNGEGFRAMKTITKEGATKSSVDRIVHKTHDGFICSTYYIDYKYDADSLRSLRLGMPMEENGVDLEYIVSFPSGTRVVSNSSKADDQGSTYMWSLQSSGPSEIKLQATVWHKLFIYLALIFIAIILLLIIIMEYRRKSVISWKQAAHIRKVEMMLLCIPIVILSYMGYEYYVGTHVTADTLAKVSQQQQEELLESREEDRRLNDTDAKKQRIGEKAASMIRSKTAEISKSLRDLNRNYQSGVISQSSARSEARSLASQAQSLLDSSQGLSEADRDVLQQLVNRLVDEADSIGNGPDTSQSRNERSVTEEVRRSEAAVRDAQRNSQSDTSDNTSSGDGADSDASSAKSNDTSKGTASSKNDEKTR